MNTDYAALGTHVHVWIGITDKKEEEYYKYFELNYDYELDNEDYIVCEFCKDVGIKWYDEDFSFFPEPLKEKIEIIDLLKDSIVLEEEKKAVVKKCYELGLKKANAMFGYAIPDDFYKDGCFQVSKPCKEYYNGLKYIGKFLHS